MIQHARSYVLAIGVALAAPMVVAQAGTIAELAPRKQYRDRDDQRNRE